MLPAIHPLVIDFSGTTNGTGSILAFYHFRGPSPDCILDLQSGLYCESILEPENNGVSGFSSYDVSFTFLPADSDPGTSPGSFVVGQYIPSTWTCPPPV